MQALELRDRHRQRGRRPVENDVNLLVCPRRMQAAGVGDDGAEVPGGLSGEKAHAVAGLERRRPNAG